MSTDSYETLEECEVSTINDEMAGLLVQLIVYAVSVRLCDHSWASSKLTH